MVRLFAPYVGKNPAPVSINGHLLLLVSSEKSRLKQSLGIIGGDRIRAITTSEGEEQRVFNELAQQSNAGIVMVSNDIEIEELLQNLRNELPWLH